MKKGILNLCMAGMLAAALAGCVSDPALESPAGNDGQAASATGTERAAG